MVGNLLHCAPDIVEATASQDGHITKLSDFLSLLVQMYNNETSKFTLSLDPVLSSPKHIKECWLCSIQLADP